MLRLFVIFLYFTCVFCYPLFLYARDNTQVVTVGYLADTNFFMDGVGGKTGYLTEILERLSRITLRKYRLVPISIDNVANKLSSGEIDILGLITKTTTREDFLLFNEQALGFTKYVIVADKEKKIFYDDIQALRGKTIALLGNRNTTRLLEQYIVNKGIRMDFVYCDSVKELHAAKTDFHLVAAHYFMPHKNIVVSLDTRPLHFASLANNAVLLREIDRAMTAVISQNLYFFSDMHRKYYENIFRQRTVLTEAQNTTLKKLGPYKVGFSSQYRPFQYYNSDGKAQGISVAVFSHLQERYDLQAELVDMTLVRGDDILDYDILLSIADKDPLQKEFFPSSVAYHIEPLVLFSQNESSFVETSEHARPILGITHYTHIDESAVSKSFPEKQLKYYPSFAQLLLDYKSHKISAMLVPKSSREYVLEYLGESSDISMPTDIVLPLRLYISKKIAPEILDMFNMAIEAITPQEMNEILSNTSEEKFFLSKLSEVFREYSGHMLIIMVFIIIVALIELVSFENRNKKKLLHILNVDKLTGLASMRKFLEVAETTLKKALPNEYMLIAADIDEFTLFNQVYGYDKGNELIIALAKNYQESFSGALCIARLKDDIFLILTKNKAVLTPVCMRAQCIKCVDTTAKKIAGEAFTISVSRGCYIIEDPTLPVSTMIDYCNMARTSEKNIHGFSIVTFTEDMKKSLEIRAMVLHTMNTALIEREFYMIFQPKVNLQTMRVTGAEALVRWQRKTGQPIYPDVFIPIFEENGFIVQLDFYTFEAVCQFINAHKKNTMLRIPPIAVNLSGFSLIHPNTLENIIALLEKYDITPSAIEIEITESALVNESDSFICKIQELKDAGFTVAMDDFGAGVSSLNRLRSIIVDVVKLDRVFLDSNLSKEKGSTVVENIVRMLKELHIRVVAEGVETAAHAQWLKDIQCDIAQGYYFAPPLKEAEFIAILRANTIYTLPVKH